MKKILLILSLCLITTGCSNIIDMDYKENIDKTIKDNSNNKIYNTFHNGYKYYLPKYMSIKNSKDYNEVINSNDYTYYLYVNVIGYNKKKNTDYIVNDDSVISYKFNQDNLSGYLNISKFEDKYLVEIMYNYAKIEVKVNEMDINEAINNSIIILSTIKYDNEIISKLIDEKKLSSKEESLTIFDDTIKSNTDFLDIIEEYDTYEEDKEDIPDYDIIN